MAIARIAASDGAERRHESELQNVNERDVTLASPGLLVAVSLSPLDPIVVSTALPSQERPRL